jgi:hypothetical protein
VASRDNLANRQVLVHQCFVVLVLEPASTPWTDDSQAETVRIDFAPLIGLLSDTIAVM